MPVVQKADQLVEDQAGRVQGGRAEIEAEIKLTRFAPIAGLLMDAIDQSRADR